MSFVGAAAIKLKGICYDVDILVFITDYYYYYFLSRTKPHSLFHKRSQLQWKIISGGKISCWKIVTNSHNHGWKSKHTQTCCKPLLSLGQPEFLWRPHVTALWMEKGEARACVGSFSARPCKNASSLRPQKDHVASQFPALPPHPQFTLLSFPLALFPPYHVSSSESVDPQLFKKQLKLPTYKHRFLCLLNLF